MKHWKKLISFLLVQLMLGEAGNPPCSNEDCYILLERDISTTQQEAINIGNNVKESNLNLTSTLQLLDQSMATVNNTFLYGQRLNTSKARLLNIFTSVRSGLASSQQQIYNLSELLPLISANATTIAKISNNAAVTVNQTINHITIAINTLDHLEARVLPLLNRVATFITEQSNNGTELDEEMMMQFELVTSQALQLFNSSSRSLNIINATLESLMNTSAFQNDVSAGILAQMENSRDISNRLRSLSDSLSFIKQLIQFYSVYISEETDTFSIAPMDRINQGLQEAIQLTAHAKLLLQNISTLIDVSSDLYTMLASYETSYTLLHYQVQILKQRALELYNKSVLLNVKAMNASQESYQLVSEAQYLQAVLQNFSGFVDTASMQLQSIDAIQISAMETINMANNTASMIMETSRIVNDSLLMLMESSNLAQSIEIDLNSLGEQVTSAVENLEAIHSSITSLEVGQMAVENITLGFISQQEYINDTEVEIETATRQVQDATYSCKNASASVKELQSQLDNLSSLSYEDIDKIRNRIMLVKLGIGDIQNMTATLSDEIMQQRITINTLENEIADIRTEKDTLTQLYNSLPQSCDEDI